MSVILAFLWEWRFVIVVVIAGILFVITHWESTKAKLYALMLQAKSLAKDEVLKSGKEQEDWVILQIVKYIPYAKFIPDAVLRKVVHYLYIQGKDYLDDGKLNGSIAE